MVEENSDEYIQSKYDRAVNVSSDINEYVATLYKYALESQSIMECGVSEGNSSWGLLRGLCDNNYTNKLYYQCDLPTKYCQYEDTMKRLTKMKNIQHEFFRMSDLNVIFDNDVSFDLTFIDTWHVYGQLKRELLKYAPITKKFIIMHDTEIDGVYGESIRARNDVNEESVATGIPAEEITKGLKYAIDEFLDANTEWKIDLVKTNNNGLTVLKRN
jgi:hypothetical protein